MSSKLLKPFDSDGWFKTGDLGFWSSTKQKKVKRNLYGNNAFKIIGRKDRMFISGGENIFPEEIENVLYQSQMVERAKVVSVKDIEFGKRPVVFIKYVDGFYEMKLRNFLEGYERSFTLCKSQCGKIVTSNFIEGKKQIK